MLDSQKITLKPIEFEKKLHRQGQITLDSEQTTAVVDHYFKQKYVYRDTEIPYEA